MLALITLTTLWAGCHPPDSGDDASSTPHSERGGIGMQTRTQEIVSRSLEGLHATRVVIAHRLSTISNAHRIYVLDDGRIVQTGTYSELIAQPGLFANLAKRQTT